MAWTSTTEMLDSLIKDYLSRRGFNNTLKSFENDLKLDKEKGFKAEKVLQQILAFVSSCDLDSLHSYWNNLDSRVFCRFEQVHMITVKKMENNLYKFYLVNCMQNQKRKECFEFFEKFAQELSSVAEWKDWFALPFTSQPENSKSFSNYFTKAWTDTFLASLHNFLAVTFACMPPPQLYNIIHQDKIKIDQLEREVELLREKVADVNITSGIAIKVPTPNYVKSLGIPGSLTEPTFVVAQPQKKKTLGLFLTKRNVTATSTKNKGVPKVSGRVTDLPVYTAPEISPSPPTVHQDATITQKSKKLSGYQLQRKELFGSASVVQKPYKGHSGSKEISSSPPVTSIPTSVQSLPAPQVTPPSVRPSTPPHPTTVPVSSVKPIENQLNITSSVSSTKEGNSKLSDGNPDVKLKSTNDVKKHTHLLLSKDEYQEHHSAIVQGRFSATGETIASCDKDGIVKIWKYEPNLTTIATIMTRSPYLSLEWCGASDSLLLLGSATGNLRLYDVSTKQILRDCSCNYPHVTHIACSPKGHQFATSCAASSSATGMYEQSASSTGRLDLWKLTNTSAEVSSMLFDSKMTGSICSIAFHPKADTLVCADSNGSMMIFDTQSGKSILNKPIHDGPVYSIEVTDTIVYSLGADGKLYGWDLLKMDKPINFPIHSLAAGPFEVSGYGGYKQTHIPSGGKLFAFEPDGHHILTCDGSSCPIYSVDNDQALLKKEITLVGHRSPVVSVDWISAFNCGHCLTGSMDGRIHVTTLLNQ